MDTEAIVAIGVVLATIGLALFSFTFSESYKGKNKKPEDEPVDEPLPYPERSPQEEIVWKATVNCLLAEMDYLAAVNELSYAREKNRRRS